ncbi:hypothetical protein [Desulfonatronum sp. SC1]|uniref:hypothetical protein n=1 Tax=Desulfonatronum sp. SC1 TaxID=2109626 RepID=UPI000D308F63|nr:hypothetical protein [Desulfonatronum sp. SC1]PTN37557.1 hypothetical protein C6366_06270 [Desulfonatronum sp. SC1]
MRRKRFSLALVLFALLAVGCSYSSVGHLQRQPWILNAEQQLEMRFWRFSYVAESFGGQYRVKGRAMPKTESLPADLGWIEDLWLAAYLSDDQGRVLAQDLRVYSSLPLDPEQGVSFTFTLRPDRLNRTASLQITFGYNMTLAPHEHYMVQEAPEKRHSGERSAVFFAHEGALTRI